MAAISQPSQNTSLPRHDHEPRHRPSRTNSTSNAAVHARIQKPPSASIRKVPYSGDPTESVADSPVVVHSHNFRQHQASASTGSASLSRNPKSGGLFAFAAAAIDKTIANISEPTIRSRPSASALSRLSVVLDSPTSTDSSNSDKSSRIRSFSSNSSGPSTPSLLGPLSDAKRPSQSSLRDPISKPYSETDASRPPPILVPASLENKMHQTSSRLLRMTDDDRPFTKDFKDLFSTLIVSLLPLSAHRVRLTRIEHTFLSEDAINNLGSLKFSQSNRMPDPKDPSRIVTTTTTTTFSMAKDMARSICQRFLDARFIESADGKMQQVYTMKGSVWQLTPKGVCVLDRFCSRNGIQQRQISDLIALGMSYLCILERDSQTDKLVMDRGTMEVIFRRMIGANGLNVKSSVSAADSDSLSDYRDGLTGVKMAGERKIGGRTYKDTFTGKACSDWLMDCCTTVDRRETFEMGTLFVQYELMEPVQHDRVHMATSSGNNPFQPTKNAIYQLTAKGRDILTGGSGRGRTSESEGMASSRTGIARDSNTQRLDKILNDAALRLLFRENLRETHCEENLSFYLDVEDFVSGCRSAIKQAQKNPGATSMDGIKEIMAQAYGIYNAFLAPGSPCELNIDHQLRNNLATRMTKAVGQDVTMIDTLHEVTTLFEDAQNAVFKLMASDSVPKFLRNTKYEHTLKNYDFDAIVLSGRGPERSQSQSNRK
ncbi:RGS-domain-containing protein [Annulohypoxylon maeteangense]|uniref:RGS-domain-containing protein n=1 Tax=Annulohypoxylon maeteangense TaxID=1927788 RepID=UPI002008ADD2|nr:RGS-domain-containing protein [Annulohypoxylon maeteangense]KAI0889101.1 RGS-domain-containing protein [Annulohypoxylon maeteangense]